MPRKKKSKQAKLNLSGRGRRKGSKIDTVILFNRHNCLFYKTIKNDKGTVVGRDYTVHEKKAEELQIKAMRAQDTITTKLMKCVRDKEYKEDIFKSIPLFFDFEKNIDVKLYTPGLFENEDNKVSVVVDKEKAMERLEELIKETSVYLKSLGMEELSEQLQTKFNNMQTEDTPIGRTEKQNPDTVQKKQLHLFSFDKD